MYCLQSPIWTLECQPKITYTNFSWQLADKLWLFRGGVGISEEKLFFLRGTLFFNDFFSTQAPVLLSAVDFSLIHY